MTFLVNEELPDKYGGNHASKVSYTMRLSYEMVHKLNTTSKDLGVHKDELIEALLRLGLQHYLNPQENPANRPVKTARDVLFSLIRRVQSLESNQQRKPGRVVEVPAKPSVSRAGAPSGAQPVKPGDIEPEHVSNLDDEDFEEEFDYYDE